MLTGDQISNQISELKREISKRYPGLLDDFPVEIYLDDIRSYPDYASYTHISPKLRTISQELKSRHDSEALILCHKLALSLFIHSAINELDEKKYPESIWRLYQSWFERVLSDFNHQPDDNYSFGRDGFLKDLGVCSQRLIPIGGPWVVDVCSIGKKPFFSAGPFKFFSYLAFVMMKAKGFQPFYRIHSFFRYLPRFTPEEMRLSYLRVAELLEKNQSVKGLYRSSWFLDPRMDRISPHLSYLRKVPEKNGAKVFRIGIRQSDIKSALQFSQKRRKLYEEGQYIPTIYAYVWPRKDLLRWAAGQHTSIP
jgi:hypothetical protein